MKCCRTTLNKMHMRTYIKYLIVLLLLVGPAAMQAQDNLRIGEVFSYYGKRHGSTMVQLSDDVIRTYDMTLYRSLSFRPEENGSRTLEWVIGCVEQDKRKAKKIKETLLDGSLKSGYYQLPQIRSGVNRFILFKLGDKRKATLIYIEGSLSSAELVDMLLKK